MSTNRSPNSGRRPNPRSAEILALLRQAVRPIDISRYLGIRQDVVYRLARKIGPSVRPENILSRFRWDEQSCGECLQPAPWGTVVVVIEGERVRRSFMWCGQCVLARPREMLAASETMT